MSWLSRARGKVSAAVAAAAVGVGALVWVASADAAAPGPGYGYLWLDNASTTVGVDHTPSTWYQRNSTGATNTVTRRATGSYDLYFPNLARFGTPMVTAYGGGSERCKVGSWRGARWPRSGTVVNVRCTTRTGTPVNTEFTATYAYATAASATGSGAYLWSDQASPPLEAAYTPNTAYQLNTTGQHSTVTREKTGFYGVRVEGWGVGFKANLTVVATGGRAGTYCDEAGWRTEATYRIHYLQCIGPDGQPADSAFALAVATSASTMFGPVGSSAYARVACWEDHSNDFGGPRECQVSEGDSEPVGTLTSRVSPGIYEVHLPTDTSSGNVQIMTLAPPYPDFPGMGRCKIALWWSDTVRVQCLDREGNPPTVGANFVLSFVS